MGCDIHVAIDWDEFQRHDGEWVTSCFADHVDIGRNYALFALMAGVRYDPRTDRDFAPLFEPKGLPERLSWRTRDAYVLRVTDSETQASEDGYCLKSSAERWVAEGSSHWMDRDHDEVTNPDWHSASWLTADELERVQATYAAVQFADASWFQLHPPPEVGMAAGPHHPDQVVTMVKQLPMRFGLGDSEWYVEVGPRRPSGPHPVLAAVIAAMRALDGDTPGRSRLVFWFDN